MKRQLLILIISLFSLSGFSQINFEKGYFINNSGERIECFIKNDKWKYNPVSFEYKETQDSQVKTASIENIVEFGIDNYSKYERHNVKIDRSSEILSELSSDRNPVFAEEELFLKVLIEGQATLYVYQDTDLTRFFYKIQGSEIEQLIHKRYINSNYDVEFNNYFRQQLYNNLNCKNSDLNQFLRIDYNKKKLVKHFVYHNECLNSDYVNYDTFQKNKFLSINIRPGINISDFEMYYAANRDATLVNYENKSTFRIGLEFELILPFNKNRWAIIVEPTYQYYKASKELETHTISIDYASIEIPIGLRYFFNLNDNSKIFLNALYYIDKSIDSTVVYDIGSSLEISSKGNFGAGVGYTYNDRYTFEFRYQGGRELLGEYSAWKSSYNTISFILGYSLFNNL